MQTNHSFVFDDNTGYYLGGRCIPPAKENSVIYTTVDGEGSVQEDLPPPLPVRISSFHDGSDGTSWNPYKRTTFPVTNDQGEKRKPKTRCLLGILIAVLVVVCIVAITVPIAIHLHYTANSEKGPDQFKSAGTLTNNTITSTSNNNPSSQSTAATTTVSSASTTPASILSTPSTSSTTDTTTESTTSATTESTTSATTESTTPTTTESSTPSTSATTESTTPATPESTTSSSSTTSATPTSSEGCPSRNRCHSCTCSNSRCPENGDISTSVENEQLYQEYEFCDGACFTEVRDFDNNKTHRGCAPKSKWKDTARDFGCYNIGVNRVCFCCGNYCNNHDMTAYTASKSCL